MISRVQIPNQKILFFSAGTGKLRECGRTFSGLSRISGVGRKKMELENSELDSACHKTLYILIFRQFGKLRYLEESQ